MTGASNSDYKIFETKNGRWLIEEVNGSSKKNAAVFNMLVRSLIDDAQYIAEAELTLSNWSAYFIKLVGKYLDTDNSNAAEDSLRLIRSLATLEKMDFSRSVKGRTAVELAQRAINSLGGGRGQYLAEGVVVSSFVPMRAIPFKIIFLLGLGEGLFPAPGRRDALDLRSARRYAGDVDPAERDRYMFLETLLSAREQIYISYVNRDEQTGDPLQPSAVVQELLHIIKNSYLGEEGIKAIRIEPPLRRHAEVIAGENIFSDQARTEAQVKRIADSWQNTTGNKPDKISANEINRDRGREIKSYVSQEDWKQLASILHLPYITDSDTPLPGESYHCNSIAVAPRETHTLSLYYLRRFLECPMQGWATALLGLAEEEEDRAAVEEEDFKVSPLTETEMLSYIYRKASTSDTSTAGIYNREALFRQLQGKLPVGTLGQIIEKKHLSILSGWDQALRAAISQPQDNRGGIEKSFLQLQKIRFGSSPEADRDEITLESPVIELRPTSPHNNDIPIKVKLTGLSQLVSQDRTSSITLRPRKLPAGKNVAAVGRAFRYLLRGLLDQAILAAIDPSGNPERQAIVVYAENAEQAGYRKLNLRRPGQDEALAWLSAVINDLFCNCHAYLFPCEAVFYEYYRNQSKVPDGIHLQQTINHLARNEWDNFSSLWGPVPQPRSYNSPTPEQATAMVTRRFGLLLDQIIGMEGF
jgi:exodeoxyribonuclease V gamma subunit